MATFPRVSPEEAKKLIDQDGYIYLDVRTEAEYAAGHPAGARNVPIMHAGPAGMQPNPDFLDVVRAVFPTETKIVVGCKAGGRSLRAAEMMTSAGYTNIVDQRAGYEGSRNSFGAITEPGWVPAGLPTETSTAGGAYGDLKARAGK